MKKNKKTNLKQKDKIYKYKICILLFLTIIVCFTLITYTDSFICDSIKQGDILINLKSIKLKSGDVLKYDSNKLINKYELNNKKYTKILLRSMNLKYGNTIDFLNNIVKKYNIPFGAAKLITQTKKECSLLDNDDEYKECINSKIYDENEQAYDSTFNDNNIHSLNITFAMYKDNNKWEYISYNNLDNEKKLKQHKAIKYNFDIKNFKINKINIIHY